MSKLVKLLQKAHAGELAAYHAYQGHWESVSDPEEQLAIQKIQKDELEHAEVVSKMLHHLGSRPSFLRDTIFVVLGRALSFLCKYTGWFMPMYVAKLIEKIGVNNYYEMLEISLTKGHPELAFTLMQLASREEEHRIYFEKAIKSGQEKIRQFGRRN